MSQAPAAPSEIKRKEYRSRALQFVNGLKFPATKDQISAHLQRRNTPMELTEDTLILPAGTFATAAEYAEAVTAVHFKRAPHTWTSREMSN